MGMYGRHAMPHGILCSVWGAQCPPLPLFLRRIYQGATATFHPSGRFLLSLVFCPLLQCKSTATQAAPAPIRFPAMLLRQG